MKPRVEKIQKALKRLLISSPNAQKFSSKQVRTANRA
jgi:hypothetical protein